MLSSTRRCSIIQRRSGRFRSFLRQLFDSRKISRCVCDRMYLVCDYNWLANCSYLISSCSIRDEVIQRCVYSKTMLALEMRKSKSDIRSIAHKHSHQIWRICWRILPNHYSVKVCDMCCRLHILFGLFRCTNAMGRCVFSVYTSIIRTRSVLEWRMARTARLRSYRTEDIAGGRCR